MLRTSSFKVLSAVLILCIATLTSAQSDTAPEIKPGTTERNAPKPYKVLTAGKRITVQTKTEISKIMVWSSSGHRFVEDNSVKSPSYSFTITTGEKFFYIMLELKDGKRYTEKVGVE